MKDDYAANSYLPHLKMHFFLKGVENVLFELGSRRVIGWLLTLDLLVTPMILSDKPNLNYDRSLVAFGD